MQPTIQCLKAKHEQLDPPSTFKIVFYPITFILLPLLGAIQEGLGKVKIILATIKQPIVQNQKHLGYYSQSTGIHLKNLKNGMSEFSEILNHPYQLLGINLNHWGTTVSPPNSASGSLFAPHESQFYHALGLQQFFVHATMVKSSKSMAEMTAGSTKNQSQRPQPGRPAEDHLEVSRVLGPGKARGSRPTAHSSVEGNFEG